MIKYYMYIIGLCFLNSCSTSEVEDLDMRSDAKVLYSAILGSSLVDGKWIEVSDVDVDYVRLNVGSSVVMKSIENETFQYTPKNDDVFIKRKNGTYEKVSTVSYTLLRWSNDSKTIICTNQGGITLMDNTQAPPLEKTQEQKK